MIKRYDPNDNSPMRQFVGMDEHEFGDWVKFDDVEDSLNFAQQLKDKISEEVKRIDDADRYNKVIPWSIIVENLRKLIKSEG